MLQAEPNLQSRDGTITFCLYDNIKMGIKLGKISSLIDSTITKKKGAAHTHHASLKKITHASK